MLRRGMLLVVLLISAHGLPQANSQQDSRVLERYSGEATPDEIAFDAFLSLAHQSLLDNPELNETVIRNALGLEGSAADPTVAARSQYFESVFQAFTREKAQDGYAVLCTGNIRASSAREIGSRMDAVDQVGRHAMKKFLQTTLNELPPGERRHFRKYLQDLKTGLSYTRIDSYSFYSNSQISIPEVAERLCSKLDSRLGRDGGIK